MLFFKCSFDTSSFMSCSTPDNPICSTISSKKPCIKEEAILCILFGKVIVNSLDKSTFPLTWSS